MLLSELLELQTSTKNLIDTIDSLKLSLTSALDNISTTLTDVQILKIISNNQLQSIVDTLNVGGAVVNKSYPTTIVPHPKPLEFKKYMTTASNPVYAVYMYIFMAASSNTAMFALLWVFTESLWNEDYEAQLSGAVLNDLVSKLELNIEQKALIQAALDLHNMQIVLA